MRIYKHRAIMIICLAFFVFSGGTCDHTRLTGDVVVPTTRVRVGEPLPLKLVVPEELSGIYRVEWEVDPPQKGEILQGAQLLDALTDTQLLDYFGEEPPVDRAALFTAKEAGVCTVYVTGFYKQTNPQSITSIELIIGK